MRFTGKRALVTGAGRGIGGGIADVLAERGAEVAVNDIDGGRAAVVADALRTHGVRTVAVQGDVSKRHDVERMFDRASADLGPIDEIGTVAAFLVSDDASYLTGQSIYVDGGWQGK